MTISPRRGFFWWVPPSLAVFIYTVILKPRPLRNLAQKIVCKLIPETLSIKGVTLALNQQDAIVSGNLALGCYETGNLDLFESLLQPGNHVFDVGANIGLYSAVASRVVGPQGLVVAIEPDFNLTVELPLKAIVRGYTWTVTPISWKNRKHGVPKLKISEMGSRYFFICAYVWLEKYFSRGDYRKH